MRPADPGSIRDQLTRYGQGRLLEALEKLPSEASARLAEQVSGIDFGLMAKLHRQASAAETPVKGATEPVEPVVASALPEERKGRWISVGSRAMATGKAAVLTMAGGQGTRLGVDGPKGAYRLPLPIGKTFFELQAEGLRERARQAGRAIPWIVMTSRENDALTKTHFRANKFFGLPEGSIRFFSQNELPLLDTSGQVVLRAPDEVYFAPDGNGSLFASLARSGLLERLRTEGVDGLFLCNIDNALIRMADPILIGCAAELRSDAVSKSVAKASPAESVGVFALRGGKATVVEYTEIGETARNARKSDGSLLYADVNIVSHWVSLDLVRKVARRELPYHTAFKTVRYLGADGTPVPADRPNAYKFESFLFDAFAYARKPAVLRVERRDEFAPVKNAAGADSPETAARLFSDARARGTR
jgi:UDP-N-acetylglucosamine pyrophosphorylase